MSFYNNFIGLKELPNDARSIVRNYSIIMILVNLAFSLTGTFSILYIIDAVGFKDAATLTAISLSVILLTDYPSGSLGDWIGQKVVVLIALSLFSLSFFLMSFATDFNDFVVVSILLGLGEAQASGALQTWLDNSYKAIDSSLDPERKNYGYSMSKIQALASLISGIAFVIGGYLATTYSREFAFQLQSVIILFTTILVLKLLSKPKFDDNIILKSDLEQPENSNESFLSFLKGGIRFLFSSKRAFFFLMGMAVFQVIWSIWGALLLFPFYFGYTGDDSSTGMMRSAIFFAGVFIQIKLSNLTKKVENDKLAHFLIFQGIFLFGGGILLMRFIPMNNSLNLFGIGFTFLLMGIAVSFTNPFIMTIIQREMVDLVPSENRNAVYSLIPTIRSAIAIPLLPFVGGLVETSGLEAGFMIMMGILVVVILFIGLALNIPDEKLEIKLQVDHQPVLGN